MKTTVILAASMIIGLSGQMAAAEPFAPLVVDEVLPAAPPPASAARRALDMQRNAPTPVGTTRDLSGTEAQALWNKVLAPKPAPRSSTFSAQP